MTKPGIRDTVFWVAVMMSALLIGLIAALWIGAQLPGIDIHIS